MYLPGFLVDFPKKTNPLEVVSFNYIYIQYSIPLYPDYSWLSHQFSMFRILVCNLSTLGSIIKIPLESLEGHHFLIGAM